MGLDDVEILLEIEDEFEIKVTDEEAQAVITAGDLADLVAGKIADQGLRPETVFERVRIILAEQMHVSIARIERSTRLIEDLGIGR